MDLLGILGLILVLLGVLALVKVIAIGTGAAIALLVIGIVLLFVGPGRRLGRRY